MKVLFKFFIFISFFILSNQAFSQAELALRPGFSRTTGFLGMEFKYKNYSVFGGYGGPYKERQVLSFGANYYFQPEGKSFYTGVNWITNAGSTSTTTFNWNTNTYDTETTYSPALVFIGGYRFVLLKYLDLKLGGGFGITNVSAFPIIPTWDVSLGLHYSSLK